MIDHTWNSIVKEGEDLFNYMTNSFEEMFDGTIIKHFDIRYEDRYDVGSEEVKEEYGEDIHNELVSWIRKEKEEGYLFDSKIWKPFRDKATHTDGYIGYRRLFRYKHYYFQLIVELGCELDECNYCKIGDRKNHFVLTLYGWKDENIPTLQPDNHVTVLADNLIPDVDWNRK